MEKYKKYKLVFGTIIITMIAINAVLSIYVIASHVSEAIAEGVSPSKVIIKDIMYYFIVWLPVMLALYFSSRSNRLQEYDEI